MLSDPALVAGKDYVEYLTKRGKGWVCEINNQVIGFSVVDLEDKNIRALFVHPGHEGKGVGKKLYDLALNWYFHQTTETVAGNIAPGPCSKIS